jgi:hypothetical protein
MFGLLSLEDNAILSAFDDHPPPQDTQKDYGNRSDKLLHELTEKTLDFIKDHHPLRNDSDQPMTFENILSWARSPGESCLYQRVTCVKFHHLLVAVFYGYAWTLSQLTKNKESDCQVPLARSLWVLLCFLWYLTESLAYYMHLDAIKGNVEHISYNNIPAYQEFAKVVDLGFRDVASIDVCDDEPEPVSLETTDSSLTYRGIMSRLVIYPAAISLLHWYCLKLKDAGDRTGEFSAHLIAVKRVDDHTLTWSGMLKALRNVHLEEDLDVAKIIKAVVNTTISNPKARTLHKVFELFQKVIQDDGARSGNGLGAGEVYPGTVHCETALVSLHKYPNRATGARELHHLVEVRIHILINCLVLNI